MPEEIKKSYNPFKMWGSWAGLVVGAVGTLMYGGGASYLMEIFKIDDFTAVAIFLNILQSLGGALQLTNPIILILQWPILPAVLVTPVVIFLYGWGIHSLFRKLGRKWRIRLLIAIATLLIAGGTYSYITGKQKMLTANPILALSVSQSIETRMSTAFNEQSTLLERTNALWELGSRVREMDFDQNKALSEQLTMLFDKVNKSTRLKETEKVYMIKYITQLQTALGEKRKHY